MRLSHRFTVRPLNTDYNYRAHTFAETAAACHLANNSKLFIAIQLKMHYRGENGVK